MEKSSVDRYQRWYYWGTLALIAYSFFCKIYLFNHLAYTSDLFMNNDMSRSWFEKGKFLQENHYGGQLPIHNYFLVPFLYPLTSLLGIRGLFVGLWVLILAAFVRISRAVDARLLPFFFALPISFWICDHATYGFGIELIQLPVSLLLAEALITQNRWRTFAWGAIMVLNKEDGAVLLAVILLSHHLCIHGLRQFWLLAQKLVVSIFIFLLGMWVQRWVGGQRSHQVVGMFVGNLLNAADRHNWIRGIKVSWLLGPPLLLFLCPREWRRWLVAVGIGFVPLAIVAFVGGAAYGTEDWMHGIHWPIRYVLLWGLILSTLLFLTVRGGLRAHLSRPGLTYVLLFLAQISVLAYYRKYYFWERFLPFAFVDKLPISDLSPTEDAFFRCLSDRLPARFPLATDPKLYTYFSRQDITPPDGIPNAWKFPEIFICHQDPVHFSAKKCLTNQETLASKLSKIELGRTSRWIVTSSEIEAPALKLCLEKFPL